MRIRPHFLISLSLLAITFRCGIFEPEQPTSGSIRIVLVNEKESSTPGLSNASAALLASVQAIVKKGSGSATAYDLQKQGNRFHAKIDGLEPGNDYSVLLYGRDSNNQTTMSGYEAGIIVRAGEESSVTMGGANSDPRLYKA